MTLYFESDSSVEGRGFDMIITSYRDSKLSYILNHKNNASVILSGIF